MKGLGGRRRHVRRRLLLAAQPGGVAGALSELLTLAREAWSSSPPAQRMTRALLLGAHRLHKRRPLHFPPYVALTDNYFDRGWVGERRLKNVVMVLEYVPSAAAIAPQPPRAPRRCSIVSALLSCFFDRQCTNGFSPTKTCLVDPRLQKLHFISSLIPQKLRKFIQ